MKYFYRHSSSFSDSRSDIVSYKHAYAQSTAYSKPAPEKRG